MERIWLLAIRQPTSFAWVSVMVGSLVEEQGRSGLSAGTTTHQEDRISHRDVATFDHKTVEGELAFEPLIDVAGDVLVPDLRVRIVCGHDAAQTEILHPDEHLADAQAAA